MNYVAPSRILAVTLFLFVVTLATTEAHAQSFVSPLVGYDFGGDSMCPEVTGCEEKNLNLGVGFGRMGDVLGGEVEFAYARDFFGKAPGLTSNVLTIMTNIMLVPNLGPVRPFGLIGVGLIKSHIELTPASLLDSNHNQFGWDVGGGLMAFFGENFGIRGDIRHFHSFQDLELFNVVTLDGEKLNFSRASAALVFKF